MLFLHCRTQEFPEASLYRPPPGILPLDPNGLFSGPLDPTPQDLHAFARFDFLHCAINQWGTQQSLAQGHPQAKVMPLPCCMSVCNMFLYDYCWNLPHLVVLSHMSSSKLILLSCFPDDYIPTRTTLIGALKYNLGINVGELARNKAEDLRNLYSCWWSHPLPDEMPYRRLLCFETNL